jgi:putative FmdB family regulatory protein
MPLYEYECTACSHRFEVIQRFSAEPIPVCPKCQGEVRRLLSAPAIHFKGTGWYVTDYGNKGKPDASSTELPAKSTNTSADTKATTADTKGATPASGSDSSSGGGSSTDSGASAKKD